jgi:acetyl-CoA C-acetyltransferase
MAEAYIVATARTAGGRKGGRLAGWHPADLAASVLDSLVDRSGVDPVQIEDVIMGCVMQAGEQSTNIARNAVMASKLPESVPATSVDRQCGSSQQALHFAAQAVMAGSMDIVIAAGVESMTRVPMGLPASLPAKNGFGHYKSPGIEKKYPNIMFSQFTGAEMMAEKYGLSKAELDEFSYNSHQLAIAAGADPARLNVNGGAIALGHPLGGSGTKLMTTLVNALKQRNKRYGLQTMCEGGGMANVTIVERL